jgi:hypothetical protein
MFNFLFGKTLHEYTIEGNFEEVQRLLNQGKDVNQEVC